MAKKWVTNNHTLPLDFALDSGGSEVLAPGESKYMSIADFDSVNNQGMRHAGLYVVTDTKPEKDSVVVAEPTTTRPTTNEKIA